jgi:hypothetical protein
VSDSVVVIDLERCRARIAKLCALGDGWNNGGGLAATAEAAAAASRLLSSRARLAGSCHIYPADDGGLLLELVHAGWDYGIEIGPEGEPTVYGVQVEGPDAIGTRLFAASSHEFMSFLDSLTGQAA